MTIFGYFDGPGDTPAFDPGISVPCPHCLLPLVTKPRRAISLLIPGDSRCYFYRTHAECDDSASDEDRQQIESSLIDSRTTKPEA
jgi:hypothetical protein